MWRVFSMVSVLSFGLWTAAPAHAGDINVSGQGSKMYKKSKDVSAARDDALRAALQDAVRRALSDKLTPQQLIEHNATIESKVLPLAKALVSQYSIVDEKDTNKGNKIYEVVIKGVVDEDMLMENLDLVGFSMDVGSRRSIAVVIDEYFSNDLPPSNEPMMSKVTNRSKSDSRHDVEVPGHLLTAAGQLAAAEAAANTPAATNILPAGFGPSGGGNAMASTGNDYYESKRTKSFEESVVEYFPKEIIERPRPNPVSAAAIGTQLLERDVRLLDAGQVNTIRGGMVGDGGLLLPVLSDPVTLSNRAMKIGAMSGSDAIMVGTTAIIYSGDPGGRHKAEATLAVRVVDTTTGDIVAYGTSTEVGLGSNSEAAASAAAERLGAKVGKDLGEQLFQYWRNRDEKGLEISVNLVGITSTKLSLAISDAITAVDGAKGVNQRVFDRTSGLLMYTVTTKRPLGEFRNDLLRALYALPELDAMEEEASIGSNWNFVVQ